jgi:predicted ATPase
LDGLPLSLELAASQTKLFSPQSLLAEFERQRASLRRMSAGSGEIARHQTLRATIRWSHDLLSSQERQLFRRLAVFVGGADIDAIYAVASQATGEDEPDSVLEVGLTLNALHALVDAGLVYREDAADVPHFTMLNPIREFALEELASSGEQPAIRELHARCYLKMIESSRSAADRVSLGADQDNIEAALRWLEISR